MGGRSPANKFILKKEEIFWFIILFHDSLVRSDELVHLALPPPQIVSMLASY